MCLYRKCGTLGRRYPVCFFTSAFFVKVLHSGLTFSMKYVTIYDMSIFGERIWEKRLLFRKTAERRIRKDEVV